MKPGQKPLTEDDLRLVARWAAACAARVLPLFEAVAPSDSRPREAIEGARAFARGGKRTAGLRNLVWAALAAAREVGDPAATAAARAAGIAAGTAFTHARITPGQEKHVLGTAVYAALARGASAGDREIRWAIQHASPAVRAIARRMPKRIPGRTRLNVLYYQLDAGLRGRR